LAWAIRLLGMPTRFVAASCMAVERGLAYPVRLYLGWKASVSLLLVLFLAIAAHGLSACAQPLMLYPDSTSFVGKADCGLHGGKVWRGDCQIMPGLPYLIYGLGRVFPWPINTPLRVVYHGCLIVSLLCGYGIVRLLARSHILATLVGLSGLLNLSFLVLG